MFRKTTLVAALIAANMVATSVATSASAQTPQELKRLTTTEQRQVIETIIREEFPEDAAETMIRIAHCESNNVLHVTGNGELVRSPNRLYFGVLQVGEGTHQREIARLKRQENIDVMGDIRAYIRFTRYLYDHHRGRRLSGFEPWPSCGRIAVTAHRAQAVRVAQTPTQVNERRVRPHRPIVIANAD